MKGKMGWVVTRLLMVALLLPVTSTALVGYQEVELSAAASAVPPNGPKPKKAVPPKAMADLPKGCNNRARGTSTPICVVKSRKCPHAKVYAIDFRQGGHGPIVQVAVANTGDCGTQLDTVTGTFSVTHKIKDHVSEPNKITGKRSDMPYTLKYHPNGSAIHLRSASGPTWGCVGVINQADAIALFNRTLMRSTVNVVFED